YSSDAGDYHASHIPGVVDEPASGYDIEPTGAMEAEDAEYIAAINPGTLIALLDRLEELEAREPKWEYGTSRPKALQAEVDWERSRKDAEDHVRGCDYGCVVV